MDKVKKSFKYLVEKAKFPRRNEFDEDFCQVLTILRLTGFYRSDSTIKSIALVVVCFLLVPLNMVLGCIKDFICCILEDNMFDALFRADLFSMSFTYSIQVLTFIKNQSRIIELIKTLQKLHDPADQQEIEVFKNRLLRVFNAYKRYLQCNVVILIIMRTLGFSYAKLIYPAIMDIFAEGKLMAPMLCFVYILIFFLFHSFLAVEFLHIVCMVRIEANIKNLGAKLRKCADDINPRLNEQALVSCIKYHCEILE